MKLKHIISITLIAGILSACESRTDWYEKINTPAEIKLQEAGRYDVMPSDTIEVSLRFGEKKIIEYSVSDNFSMNDNYTFYLKSDVENLVVNQDAESKVISIESLINALEQDDKAYTYNLPIYVKDYYERESAALIKITLQANRAPIPSLSYSELSADGANPKYEFLFSAEESVDPDGDDIVAYEYLFDGTPRKSNSKFIYEKDKNGKEITNHMPGNAAFGGTYIYATKLDAVKHAFQSTGNHTAYVRCKDSWGCWSSWKELKLVIKE